MSDIIEEFPNPNPSQKPVVKKEFSDLAEYKDDGSGVPEDQQQLLLLTQNARKRIIEKLMGPDLANIPESTREQMLLVSALDGTDRQVLARARLKADTKNANNMAALAAEIIKGINVNVRPPLPIEGTSRVVPEIPDDKAEIQTVPGEMDIGIKEMSYDAFIGKDKKA